MKTMLSAVSKISKNEKFFGGLVYETFSEDKDRTQSKPVGSSKI
ncbi:MAG TPA: hypothetical protein VJ599_03420 [Nitrososphaeraceae archaeon]|nr:hypothetical protein [Nitrososphaeraceae archaeon]